MSLYKAHETHRALAGMKWCSSVNFTGASIICNRLGSDFLPSYYFGKLSLRSIRIRTTVFSIYSIYYRLRIEEHYLGFKQWHQHYKKAFQDFFYLAVMFHCLVFLNHSMENCMYHRGAITFELNVLLAQLPLPFFFSLYFTTLCPNYSNIKCLWKDKYSVHIAIKAETHGFKTKVKRCSHKSTVIKKWKGF